ncbi:aminotransferase class I/II-fold pyridoxal phosphate-dependent enzyme [Roseobacter sp. HKCCD9010]|uniref:amino acid aminotransferase n=1 Tax=unclassified Roseobacter TaxID=196798 RepID=UPI001490DE59|nr:MULTISPECIES: amino acid aminotransferase [unclassified Roseobacter]MBF9050938.1 aminotransferase class I/II-fold pyridoxal phosphate-dependent enzyme [Rhodobacterales bacterium HKCCD4356]NNV12707.1 aminotransferase class I/II-fold pyridoxal phosphate-dependent enzyme [Roseobacter sp. HKCCD7357]NNV16651.1 aminotransferase class I/II-fold pyridoxal phosphate-dependent enzyme [Roseobacter sp. HKCCD8768]NNV26717.1 aminotransferase class I/II-fold pyridoxal phosphate-dependent enzyme [Roseobacte
MFETLTPPETDQILRIMTLYAADERPQKVDLGVGVYRTADGRTPVMAAVKQAEERIWQSQETKSYLGLAGDPGFHAVMRDLILDDAVPASRVAALATPGGTGAVRQILELTRNLTPDATVWISDPSWPNHRSIAGYLGLNLRLYRYYDPETGGLDRDGMMGDLAEAKTGDVVLLHGCCHNPSGVELSLQDWRDVGALLQRTGAIPFVDIAYQGFGEGLEEDAAGTRILAGMLPEVLIAASCSKNFGLYRDRVGIAFAITADDKTQAKAQATLAFLNRQNYSFPPDHGARVVETILTDPALTETWRTELREMREGMSATRQSIAEALRAETGSDRFGFLASNRGMFSLIGATPEQVEALRDDHAIYVVGDGRMNIAGLTPDSIPYVARAVAKVMG